MDIINYREEPHGGDVLSTFDVNLNNGIVYPNFKLRKGKTGGYFLSRPSYFKGEDSEGNKKWGHYPEFNEERWKDFRSKVMEILKPFLPV